MSRGNRLLECPDCEEPTLIVKRSDVDENNVGMRRYECQECRKTWTTIEVFFVDDQGDPDSFNQIALNVRIGDREKYHRQKGTTKPRRMLKATDEIRTRRKNGRVTIYYHRNPRVRPIFTECHRGHSFTPENTYYNTSSGAQQCRACRRISQKAWNDRNRDRVRAMKRIGDRARRAAKRNEGKELAVA